MPKHIQGKDNTGRKCKVNTMWASMSYDFETKFWRNPIQNNTKAMEKVELYNHDTLA